jgi:hypothetical protein
MCEHNLDSFTGVPSAYSGVTMAGGSASGMGHDAFSRLFAGGTYYYTYTVYNAGFNANAGARNAYGFPYTNDFKPSHTAALTNAQHVRCVHKR